MDNEYYDENDYDDEEDDELDEPDYDYPSNEEENEQTFYVSRHLNSCNNMVDNIKWTNPSYKFSEPPLSMWGVISGLALQREPLGNFQNKVYVSCLVRTWMTAIIEYLPYTSLQRNKGAKSLNLVVSPYIKEADLSNKYYVGQTIDTGNMPINVDEQIEKIKYFFSFLVLIQKYVKQMKSKTTSEDRQQSYNNNIMKIQTNLDKILLNKNEINIIFPSFKNRKEVKISLEYDDTDKKLKSTTNELYDDYSYFDKISKDKEFSLELLGTEGQQGGTNYNYFEAVLNSFLEQNSTKSDEVIDVFLGSKKLKINSISKKDIFNKIPNVSAYTTSFGKESILLFIDWIKNVMRVSDEDIYVVAHSNIMQATLYNICGKIKNNIIKKKNVNDCQAGLYDIVKKQNIWELIIKVKDENLITSVEVRPGQEKPNNVSKRALNYGKEKELSCGKNMQNLDMMIKENDIIVEAPKNIIRVQQGIKQLQPQAQPQLQQPEKKGLFGKIKNFFTRGKGGRKYTRRGKTRTKMRGRTRTMKRKMRKNNRHKITYKR
jgi:hypothetical protein